MKFIEKEHKYVHEELEYIPVTYFVKSFQEYVDWDKEAEKKAAKMGVDKNFLLKQWADKKTAGAEKGTKFHKFMEDVYTSAAEVKVANRACKVESVKTIDGIKEDELVELKDDTVYTEKMIWSKKYKVCGTADLVEVVDGKINVKDYKTNLKIDTVSWYHPTKGFKKLLSPLKKLDDCNFNIFQLQLNTYMFMLLEHNKNLKIGKMEILHVKYNEDGDNIGMTHIPVKQMQREVKRMLNLRLKTL